jgi:hypothetical protein
MSRTTPRLAILVPAVALLVSARADTATPVAYPEGYRSWTHVKSMVIQPGHPLFDAFGGIHHVYANPAAVSGYRAGRFPDGAVLVFDLLAAPVAGGAVTEGPRKVLAVMHKDAARFPGTGGWGYEGFAEGKRDQRIVKDAVTACHACHVAQKDKDFVFSAMRD